jgi:DNA-binding transcriptional MocR family regulator
MDAAPPPFASNTLSRDAGATLTEQLAERYAERIHQGLLLPGARLPSVRECARRHGVSPATVVAAYDQLLARGLVEARRQRGFFVREPRTSAPRIPSAAPPPARPAPVDATALIRGMFHHAHASPQAPGLGTLPAAWLDLPLLQGTLRRVLAQGAGASALEYGDPAGDPRLRAALAARLGDFGVNAPPSQIVTTLGATHALDLLSRLLLHPGDAVLVDEPGWAVEYARLSRMGMRLLPVPRGPQGPDLDVLRGLIQAHHPRLYVTVSVLHNPTGAMLSLAAAHQVLKLAEAHDLMIVEDDTYAHLAPPHAPRLAALDGLQRTVYVSGFSKILTPGWRVGFVAAPSSLVDRLVDAKLLSALTTPAVLEQAVALCLEQGSLRRHAERVSTRLDAARSRSVRLALDAGCRFAAPPQGLFGWLDVGVNTDELAQLMLDDGAVESSKEGPPSPTGTGWLLAPGSLFHATPRPTTLMRINFATSQEARFWKALERARSAFDRPSARGKS